MDVMVSLLVNVRQIDTGSVPTRTCERTIKIVDDFGNGAGEAIFCCRMVLLHRELLMRGSFAVLKETGYGSVAGFADKNQHKKNDPT